MSITLPSPAVEQASMPCPSWCSHDEAYPSEHSSVEVPLTFPRVPGFNVPTQPLMQVSLYSSAEFPDVSVMVDVRGEDGVAISTTLDPADAERFADRLITFASHVRHMAALAARPVA